MEFRASQCRFSRGVEALPIDLAQGCAARLDRADVLRLAETMPAATAPYFWLGADAGLLPLYHWLGAEAVK
jgi:hypothetical protein